MSEADRQLHLGRGRAGAGDDATHSPWFYAGAVVLEAAIVALLWAVGRYFR